jgi:uncharacterized membrane protein
MTIFFRALRLLAMTVWVGGLIFFAFILAPLAFHVLPTAREAGSVVGGSLRVLNAVGYMCGLVFLIAAIALWFRTDPRGRRLLPFEFLLVVAMMAATMVVQRGIIPAMERDRIATGGDIEDAASDNPSREDFERLHSISERVEGAALLLGLASIVLIAAEPGTHRRVQAS